MPRNDHFRNLMINARFQSDKREFYDSFRGGKSIKSSVFEGYG